MRLTPLAILLLTGMLPAAAQQVIVPPRYTFLSMVYDELGRLQPNLVQVRLPNEKAGLIELPSGKEVIPPLYDEVQWHQGTGVMLSHPEDRPSSVLLTRKGKTVDFPNARLMFSYMMEEGFQRFLYYDQEGSMGVADNDGTIRIPHGRYTTIEPFIENRAIAQLGEKWVVLDTNGTAMATFPDLQMLESYSNGMARFQREGLFGFLDLSGKEVIPPRFTDAFPFQQGLAAVVLENGKSGCLNTKGEMVIPALYDYCQISESGHVVVGSGEYQGLLDASGRQLIAPDTYTEIMPQGKSLAIVRVGDLYGATNLQGKEILPLAFTFLFLDTETGHFSGSTPTGMGLYDETGKALIQPRYTVVSEMQNEEDYEYLPKGIVRIGIGEGDNIRWGYARGSGEVVLPPNFDYLQELTGEVAVVVRNDHMGMVSLQGKEIIPMNKYLTIGYQAEGLYPVVDAQNRYGFVDHTGKEVVPPIYQASYSFQDGLAAVQTMEGKWGIINTSGKMVVQPVYDEIMPLEKHFFGVLQQGLWGILRAD